MVVPDVISCWLVYIEELTLQKLVYLATFNTVSSVQ